MAKDVDWAACAVVLVDPRGSKLIINEDEAARVRAIYELYLEHQSLLTVVGQLDQRCWINKRWITRKGTERGGKVFTKTSLHKLLTNVTYLGKLKYKDEVHEGEHEAIVNTEVWQRVQGCSNPQWPVRTSRLRPVWPIHCFPEMEPRGGPLTMTTRWISPPARVEDSARSAHPGELPPGPPLPSDAVQPRLPVCGGCAAGYIICHACFAVAPNSRPAMPGQPDNSSRRSYGSPARLSLLQSPS